MRGGCRTAELRNCGTAGQEDEQEGQEDAPGAGRAPRPTGPGTPTGRDPYPSLLLRPRILFTLLCIVLSCRSAVNAVHAAGVRVHGKPAPASWPTTACDSGRGPG